jgi:hypothetical protein
MQPTDAFQRLTEELTELRRGMELFQKRAMHKIDAIRIEVGPEEWNTAYRIASYLAIRNVLRQESSFDFGDNIEFD